MLVLCKKVIKIGVIFFGIGQDIIAGYLLFLEMGLELFRHAFPYFILDQRLKLLKAPANGGIVWELLRCRRVILKVMVRLFDAFGGS